METDTLYATGYIKYFDAGRTCPCVFRCEDEHHNYVGDYVVKLRSTVNGNATGLLCELVGSHIASHLNILCPRPAIIDIDQNLVPLINDPRIAEQIQHSVGKNFGTLFMPGYTTWVGGRDISPELWPTITKIFAFDALIQNPDRRPDKPNLLNQGNDILVIDHESGFSFIYNIFPDSRPWDVTQQQWIRNHIFFSDLKQYFKENQPYMEDLSLSLKDLHGAKVVERSIENAPNEWLTDSGSKICDHINTVLSNVDRFVDSIRRVLQ